MHVCSFVFVGVAKITCFLEEIKFSTKITSGFCGSSFLVSNLRPCTHAIQLSKTRMIHYWELMIELVDVVEFKDCSA